MRLGVYLYQIFTCAKNTAVAGGAFSRMLFCARIDEDIQPGNTYMMSGRISVKALDLHCDFQQMAGQLGMIADAFMLSGR